MVSSEFKPETRGGYRPETDNNPGRPPKAKDELSKAIHITLSADSYAYLLKIKTDFPRRSYSQIIDKALYEHWNIQKGGR